MAVIMEAVMCASANASESINAPSASKQQMPLTFLRNCEEAHLLKIRGNDEMHRHLESLGFVPGAPLKVISKQSGNLIIEIKCSQVALDKATASKIIAY